MDEATSALDNQSEKEVQNSLDNISKRNVTTLIISHRLSTIKNGDVIYILKNGKVEEMGTHEELIVKSQLGDDQNKARVQRKLTEKKTIIGKLSKEYSNIISNIEEPQKKGFLKEEKLEIKYSEIMNLISDHILNLIIGTIGGFFYGGGNPITEVFFGQVINSLSPQEDLNKMRRDSLILSLSFLILAVFGGLSFFLKIWKLGGLAVIITSRMRNKFYQNF